MGLDPKWPTSNSTLTLPSNQSYRISTICSTNKTKIIGDEVDHLPRIRCIKGVLYPRWLIDVVVVPKKNEKWKVYIDFRDLNKPCPKDSFPQPEIDQMVNGTTEHQFLSLINACLNYIQILMDVPDQEEATYFVTDDGFCYSFVTK